MLASQRCGVVCGDDRDRLSPTPRKPRRDVSGVQRSRCREKLYSGLRPALQELRQRIRAVDELSGFGTFAKRKGTIQWWACCMFDNRTP
jgi:hypothetical protein